MREIDSTIYVLSRSDQNDNLPCRIIFPRVRNGSQIQPADANLLKADRFADFRTKAGCVRRSFSRKGGRKEHSPRNAMLTNLIDLPSGQLRIDDDRSCIEANCSNQQSGKCDAIFTGDHHAVPSPHAQRREIAGDVPHMPVEVAVSPGCRRRSKQPDRVAR
ncbi:hypothetical protein ACVIU7_004462 [Bradyrhizobium liaoningense]|nr:MULTISPECIES: hypothetical protein [Bradyrhizobium]WLB86833.1 hypothetical protein QIH91_28870 [Bradyrhizobium japonicum USDA 135]GLR95241.1 hypothetical protein GCM10007858_28750 [Bradyrhizobium liaoningense]